MLITFFSNRSCRRFLTFGSTPVFSCLLWIFFRFFSPRPRSLQSLLLLTTKKPKHGVSANPRKEISLLIIIQYSPSSFTSSEYILSMLVLKSLLFMVLVSTQPCMMEATLNSTVSIVGFFWPSLFLAWVSNFFGLWQV